MRVNWKPLLAILGGLLLPVPLVLLLANELFPRPQVQAVGGRTVSPVLTAEERLRLRTYHRECLRKEDCEPPLGCLNDIRAERFYCADSECVTDAQCPEGFACLPLPTNEGGPLVRYCIPSGVRKEGESCVSIPSNSEEACQPGLLCGKGWCGRPCQSADPKSCPEGFFCGDTIPGPACLPSCAGRSCPESLSCVRDARTGASACVVVHGQDCQQVPCAEGRKCMAVFGSRTAGHVWMECYPQCDKGLPPCPEGFFCEGRACRKACDPNGPNVCEPGYRCLRRTEQQPWMCQPDM
jgi:hypothetical protein